MTYRTSGIHHVTAIAGDPQRNVDFYTGVLGLRLVKLTVNFDAPDTYHLYYGDGVGSPGTILTFFPWPAAPRGVPGAGQTSATAFSVPTDSLDYWRARLAERGVALAGLEARFGERVLRFADPAGLPLELVADGIAGVGSAWLDGPVPAEQAIRGFHSVTLAETDPDRTGALLTEGLGFRRLAAEGNRTRYVADGAAPARHVDLLAEPAARHGRVAVGSVHHVAWRSRDEAEQLAWRAELLRLGLQVTPVADRSYFRSIYFREPGGVLFEIATDPPGFAVDEPVEALGTSLKLPPQYERARAQIERALPPLRLPAPLRRP